jgi:hypothetical protein
MIKGKYVAQIEIDILVDENTPNLLPFDQLKNAVHNEMTAVVKSMLNDEFSDIGTITVCQQFADLWKEAAHDKHPSDPV